MQRGNYRLAGLVVLFGLLVAGLAAVGKLVFAPTCTFVSNRDGLFYKTRTSGGIVVLSDSLMRDLLGDNWKSKTLYANVQSWHDSKGGEMFEPDGLRALGNFSPPTLQVQRADAITDYVIFCREDRTALGLSVDMGRSTVTVFGRVSTAERAEELLPDGSIRLKPKP